MVDDKLKCFECKKHKDPTEFLKRNVKQGRMRCFTCKDCMAKMNTPKTDKKFCFKCLEEKPNDQFGRRLKAFDGLDTVCSKCRYKIASYRTGLGKGLEKKELEKMHKYRNKLMQKRVEVD